ncbi:MAG TPA: hypothetical protein VNR61_11950 [Niallia sp.]|nr:hypothetical protein [Niallia sp.]
MSLLLQAFTNTANTSIIADNAGGALPKTPVVVAPTTEPLIDGNSAYLWSPTSIANQTVTFRSTFTFGTPLLGLALPLSFNYAFAGNDTVLVTGTLQIVNIANFVIATIPLFSNVLNTNGPNSVEIASADTLLALNLLGNTARITIDAIVTAPVINTGKYLGQLTVRSVV